MSRPELWEMDGSLYPYMEVTEGHERDIEMPWAERFLRAAKGQILEVGNSTQRLYPHLPLRDIVCRYDELSGAYPVFREDIVTWDAGVRYDKILAVSTLEHVGHDYEEPDDNRKAIVAVAHCMQLLKPGGEFAFTIPCGFHGSLELWLLDRPWAQMSLMVRANEENEWVQRPVAEHSAHYPGPWGAAHKVLFFRYVRPVDE